MQLRVFTLPFSDATGGFPDEVVRHFLVGKRVLRLRDHLLRRDGLPYLAVVVTYADDDAEPRSLPAGGGAAREARTDPHGKDAYRAILKEADWPVFKALAAWRGERARHDGVPHYVVATNRLLAEVAVARPQSKAALGAVPGFGEAKVARYADDLLKLLAPGPAPVPRETAAAGAAP